MQDFQLGLPEIWVGLEVTSIGFLSVSSGFSTFSCSSARNPNSLSKSLSKMLASTWFSEAGMVEAPISREANNKRAAF